MLRYATIDILGMQPIVSTFLGFVQKLFPQVSIFYPIQNLDIRWMTSKHAFKPEWQDL